MKFGNCFPVNGMANHCHIYQHGNQGVLGFLLCTVIVFLVGVGCSGCAAYTIRHHNTRPKSHQLSDGTGGGGGGGVDPEAADVDIDRFYFPTDEGLREFQQILLRELGLTKVPDLSKVNITRDEYDRQRQQMLLDDDMATAIVEYRQFAATNQEDEDEGRFYKETVILNHGDVKAIRRRRPTGVEWKLRFRAPSSTNGSRWEEESSHPLELHWALDRSRSKAKRNPFRSHRSWSLVVRVDHNTDALVIRPEDLESSGDSSSVKPNLETRLDGWLDQLNFGYVQEGHVLPVSVVCYGRDCHSLRHWRLSAQLRLGVWSSQDDEKDAGRVKRHLAKKNSPVVKKNSGSSSSGRNNNNSVNSKKRLAPQPKDILLGQQHTTGKKGSKSSGSDCSTSAKSKKCCPHSLKINFRQLPGFDWILEPSEIDIFMCKGDCHYAQFTAHGHHQHASNPASNHALFQGYLHTINKRLVPKLCCTPSKLDSVQVVHYDQDNPAQLTTTKWEGAIVRECACA